MAEAATRVLVVEDEPLMRDLLTRVLDDLDGFASRDAAMEPFACTSHERSGIATKGHIALQLRSSQDALEHNTPPRNRPTTRAERC